MDRRRQRDGRRRAGGRCRRRSAGGASSSSVAAVYGDRYDRNDSCSEIGAAAVSGAESDGRSRSGATETLVRRRREIVLVLRSVRIFA